MSCQVFAYGSEHAVGLHELIGFGEGDPADFGELVAVADEDVGAVRRPGGHLDHGATGCGVDAAADLLVGFAGSVLAEAHDEWQVADKRCLSESSMALITTGVPDRKEVAAPALLTA